MLWQCPPRCSKELDLTSVADGSQVNDLALMRSIASRDRTALHRLYDKYSPTLLTLCSRLLADRSEAEDLLIDVFWEVWNKAERYDPVRAAPLTYLVMLCRSRAIDRHRSANAVKKMPLGKQISVESAADKGLDIPDLRMPVDDADLAERQEKVRAAVKRLSAPQRQTLELAFFEGLSHTEIADKTNIPLGTVKSHIRLGLIRLREILRNVGVDAESTL
jgi:RNA polymerase sigma-70 factor (ECF subfamily)